jgi:hypothetical protein
VIEADRIQSTESFAIDLKTVGYVIWRDALWSEFIQ